MFPTLIVNAISNISPILGTALGGPLGAIVGSLISSILGGVDMQDSGQVVKVLSDPDSIKKLKELELQFSDLQNARLEAAKETGYYRLVRPLLILLAHIVLIVNVYLVTIVADEMLKTVLILFMYYLVSEIRQSYKFYFGSGDELPNFRFKK